MLVPAPRAASRPERSRRHALVPLILALATVLAQLLLPLAHLEERRLAARQTAAVLCASPETHLHAGSPAEGLPHDARHCAVCSATAQARSTLVDAAPRALPAPGAAALRLAVRLPLPPPAEAPRRTAAPRAPPSRIASV